MHARFWHASDFCCAEFAVRVGSSVTGQTIFFAVSPDLYNWTLLPAAQNFSMGPPDLYGQTKDDRWDGVFSVPQNASSAAAASQYPRYGFWTATPKGDPPVHGVNQTATPAHLSGFGSSPDGISWVPLPSPEIDWSSVSHPEDRLMGYTELGAVSPIAAPDGTIRWYAMVGGRRLIDTGGYGMWAFVADQPTGPWKPQPHNFALMMGEEACGYDTRFVADANGWSTDPAQLLVNHDSSAKGTDAMLAPLKVARVDELGTLKLGWWPGNDLLKGPYSDALILENTSNRIDNASGTPSWTVRFLQNRSAALGQQCFALGVGVLIEGQMAGASGFFVETEGGGGLVIAASGDGQMTYTRCLAVPPPPPPPPPRPCLPRSLASSGTSMGAAVEWSFVSHNSALCALPNGSETIWRGMVCSTDGKLLFRNFTTPYHNGAAHNPARPCAWPCAPTWCGMGCGEPATGVPLLPDSLCLADAAVPPPPPPPSPSRIVCKLVAHVPRGISANASPSAFRLLVRGSMTEAYIDDYFLIPAAADSSNCAGASAVAVTGE
jgi:hypothetical protein